MSKQPQNEKTDDQTELAVTLHSIVVGAATLADFKEALAKQVPVIYSLPKNIVDRALVEGVYRLFSAETAGKGDKIMEESAKIADRLERGYWSIRDEKAATQSVVAAKTGGKKVAYGRMEILGALRDVTPKAKLASLKTLETWEEEKLLAFFVTQSAKPESAVAKAKALLDERAEAKAKAELDAMLAEFEEVDL